MDFGRGNGGKLAPKWDEKSILTAKGDFSKNLVFRIEKQCFLRSSGSKFGAKID